MFIICCFSSFIYSLFILLRNDRTLLSRSSHNNILFSVKTLATLSASNTTGRANPGNAPSDFQITQKNVLAIQQKGIDIRAQNQKLASSINNPSAKGLAVVAMAQTMEVEQVKTLTGSGAKDAATLKMLVTEVEGGTKQNMMNLQAAESQCKKA